MEMEQGLKEIYNANLSREIQRKAKGNIGWKIKDMETAIKNAYMLPEVRGSAQIRKQQWYDTDCERLRKKSFALLDLYRKYDELTYKQMYLNVNREYRRICQTKRIQHENNTVYVISQCRDSSTLWKLLRKKNGTKYKIGVKVTARQLEEFFLEKVLILHPQKVA